MPIAEKETLTARARPQTNPMAQIASLTLTDLPRLKRLRQALLNERTAICIERARLVTDYFRRHGFEGTGPLMRQANVLAYLLDNLPTPIFDDELIAGSTTSHRLGALLFPEFLAQAIWPELATIDERKHDPVRLAQDDAGILAGEVFPFWRDLTVTEYVRREGGEPQSLRLAEQLVFYILSKANGISHIIPNYSAVVERGLEALVDEAATKESEATDPEVVEFHMATQISLKALIGFAERYALACEAAAGMARAQRADELRELAATLKKVPAGPARTLHEGLQAIWITQVALHQESSNTALSFGRLDQVLYPLYRTDMECGRLDTAGAAELMGSFFIKMGDHTPLVPCAGHELFGGSSTNQAVTIGGIRSDGSDGTNELTYLMLKVGEILALREPNLCARAHKGAPGPYRRAVMQSIASTGAAPAIYNDEAVVYALTEKGVALEDARDYGVIGCVETTSAGRTMGMTGAILLNLASVLELALNGGVHPLTGLQVGPNTGGLATLESFDELYSAFKLQLDSIVTLAVDGNARFAEAHAVLHPTPLLSSLIEGTSESGRDVTAGGARYNSSGVAVIGLADVADSLTAIRQVVFDRKLVSLKELAQALAADFDGYEKVRALLQYKAPKYGTDDGNADSMAVELVSLIDSTFSQHVGPRGGRYHVGFWTITMHTGFGKLTGSLPSGRRRGEPLASGATPVNGVARKGPTASLASTAKLPARQMANCIAVNHKLPRSILNGRPEMIEKVEQLVRAYLERGGMQIQFTVQDRQTLLDAQANPEKYRDLLVRVSGYTAYFCDLNRSMQDEIIARTEDLP